MKKILIAFLFILTAIPTSFVAASEPESAPSPEPAAAQTIAISGKVFYKDTSGNQKPAEGFILLPRGYNIDKILSAQYSKASSDGSFSIPDFPKDTALAVINNSEKTQKVVMEYADIEKSPTNLNLTLDSLEMEDVLEKTNIVGGCDKNKLNATKVENKNGKCIPQQCKDGYLLKHRGSGLDRCVPCTEEIPFSVTSITLDNRCNATICEKGFEAISGKCVVDCDLYRGKLNATNVARKTTQPTTPMADADYSSFCYPTECDSTKYNLVGEDEEAMCAFACDEESKAELINNGAVETMVQDGECVAKSCACEYTLKGSKCVPWDGNDKSCTPTTNGAITGERICNKGKETCKIKTCADGYTLNESKNKCESDNKKPCTDQQLSDIAHAKSGKQQIKGDDIIRCIVTACEDGYDPTPDGSACTPKMVLSAEDYQKEIADLSKNADAMHEKETSWENKLIGAAGIGATGIGGSMVGAALSEQAADAAAEREMSAYIQSFQCDYGNGKNVAGGTVNFELPGGNDMVDLYAQYAQLATDLKARKEALGLRPGIESEIVIDKAETGLYDDVGTGITGGMYASIARAMLNPDGEDAKMWAAQKEATANKLKTGAIVAGVGAVGSLAANIAVNHNNPNKVQEIKQKYEKMKVAFDKLQQRNDNRQPARKCSDYTGASGNYDNCICHNDTKHWWFSTEDGCNECEDGKVVNSKKNGCECPTGTIPDTTGECKPKDDTKCLLTGNDILRNPDGTCKCMEGAGQPDSNECKCPHGRTEDDSACAPKPEEPTKPSWDVSQGDKIAEVTLKSDEYFKPGYPTLTKKGESDLDDFKKNAEQAAADAKLDLKTADDYCVIIVGKTDHQGFKDTSYYFKKGKTTEERNKLLSKDRADSVKDYIQGSFNSSNFMTYGIAAADCPSSPIQNAQCRTVNVIMVAGSCRDNKTNTNWIDKVVEIEKATTKLQELVKQ